MSDLLNIGAAALRVTNLALQTTGNNVANADVAGYARRSAPTIAGPALSTHPLYIDRNRQSLVGSAGIIRSADQFALDAALVSTSNAARATVRAQLAGDAQTLLSTAPTLADRLTGLEQALAALDGDGASLVLREQLLATTGSTTTALHGQAEALDALADDIAQRASRSIDAINRNAAALAGINQQLARAPAASSLQATLTDARDATLAALASEIGIDVRFDQNGRAEVRLQGSSDAVLVSGRQAQLVDLRLDSGLVALSRADGSQHLLPPDQGALSGLVEGHLMAGDLRRGINAVAERLVLDINSALAEGVDLDAVRGTALLAFDPADPAGSIAVTTTDARALALATRWTIASDERNVGTAQIEVRPDATAVALPLLPAYRLDVVSAAQLNIVNPADNSVLQSLALPLAGPVTGSDFALSVSGTLVAGDRYTIRPRPGGSNDSGIAVALSASWAAAGPAAQAQTQIDRHAARTAAADALSQSATATDVAARERLSAAQDVNIDEESARLVELQQAYEAAAQVIATARDLFQTLLDAG